MHHIGKIDKSKIGHFADKIITDEVVLTDERKLHIFNDHKNDYELIINKLDSVAWIIRDKNLDKLIKHNKTLYKSE